LTAQGKPVSTEERESVKYSDRADFVEQGEKSASKSEWNEEEGLS
jgi:hypothetical protein